MEDKKLKIIRSRKKIKINNNNKFSSDTQSLNNKMNKFGILIANPPFIKDEITSTMDYLVSEIYKGSARYCCKMV